MRAPRFLLALAALIILGWPIHASALPVTTIERAARVDLVPHLGIVPAELSQQSINGLREAMSMASLPAPRYGLMSLSPANSNGWYIVTLLNATPETRWRLEFGAAPLGREGSVKDFGVFNLTTNRALVNALERNAQRMPINAVPIDLPTSQPVTVAIFLGVHPAQNFVSSLSLRPETAAPGIGYNSLINNAFIGLLGGIALCALIVGFVYHVPTGVLSALAVATPLVHILFMPAPLLAWADPALAWGSGLWFLLANIFLLVTTLLQARGGVNALSGAALLMCLVSLSAVLVAFVFGTSAASTDIKTFLVHAAPLLPQTAALIVCLQSQLRRNRAGRFAFLAAVAGIVYQLIFLAYVLVPSLPPQLAFAPWIALPLQGLCFIMLLFARGETIFADRLRQESLKLREAEQLSRMKQSKEAADQARLMRVIEREREVMEELRERESQRTDEMRLAKDAADEANRAKSAFLAVVSHEIRTPMTGIMGMVRLLLDSAISGVQREYAQTIKDSGDSMLRLLNDILDFSKIERDHLELEDIEFDLPQVLRSIVRLMSGQAQEKGLYLTPDIGDDVPRFVRGDPARLRQVLLNLVNNALKFTKQGGVTIALRKIPKPTQAVVEGDLPFFDEDRYIHSLTFSVIDTGIGIDHEAQKSIFNPFSQADTSITRKFGGTGLGLAICKRLVEAMGGAITIDSTPGQGSSFMFTLRMAEGFSDEAGIGEAEQNTQVIIRNLSILVVEDNAINQRVIREMLERDHHSVTIASDGREAVMLAHQNRYDLILMDEELPELSGGDATQMIREGDGPCKEAPILGLTGNAGKDDVIRLRALGMNDVLPKPIDPVRLRNAMADLFADQPHEVDQAAPAPAVADNGPSQSMPVLDEAMLGTLKTTLGEDSLRDLVGSLFDKAEEIIGDVRKAIEAKDSDLLNRKGHELKGMAGNFGLMALSHIGAVLEKAGKANNVGTAAYLAETLDAQLQEAREALEKFMSA